MSNKVNEEMIKEKLVQREESQQNIVPLSPPSLPSPKKDKSDKVGRKLYVNVTIEYVSNVDTKLETFDTRFFFRFEWEPTEEEISKYLHSEQFNYDLDDSKENKEKGAEDEKKYEKYFLCPEFRYPNAKEFTIVKDDGIKFDTRSKKAKGGYLMTATILEKLELRNFPLDVQHFSIIIECVNSLEEFEFFPRTSEGKQQPPSTRSVTSIVSAGSNDGKKNKFVPKNKFLRLRSENVILSDFQLKNILAEITESKEENASQRNRKHTILFVSVVMERVVEAYFWRLGLYLVVLCSSGLSTWSVEVLDNRLNMLFTLLLTMVALQMVVNSTVPNIPYLTLLDKYTIFSFFFIFILILETSLIGIEHFYDGSVDHAFFWIFLGGFLLFHVWFIWYCYQKKFKEEDIKSTQCRHERDEYFKDDVHLKTYEEYCVDAQQDYVECKDMDGKTIGKKYYDTTQMFS